MRQLKLCIIGLIAVFLFTVIPFTAYGANEPWKTPPIPKGWSYVTGAWNTGYVIKDFHDNEFVWVPVGAVNAPGGVATLMHYDWEQGIRAPDQVSYEKIPSQITTAIATTGGFYVARYEASNNGGKAQSKINQQPWNTVNWYASKAISESMSLDWGWTGVYSHLLYDKEWDVICKWLENSGANVAQSLNWGNYNNDDHTGDNGLMNTGSRSEFCKNNIYDFAGNLWEWTMDACSDNRILRGGSFCNYGHFDPASHRFSNIPSYTNYGFGFRSAFVVHLNSASSVVLTNPAQGAGFSEVAGHNQILISGTVSDADNDDVTVYLQIKKGANLVFEDQQTLAQCDGEGKPFSFSFNVDETLSEGEYTVNVWANDGK